MKESVSRIQQYGSSQPLLDLLNRWRIQKLSVEYAKNNKEDAYVVFVHHDRLSWYEGIVEMASSVLLELNEERMIEVDVDSHELLQVNGEDVSGIEHKQVLNLNDDGERWEGDVLNDEPYGWGVLYDKEGEKAYEGFRIGDVNVCYGTRYYSDIQKVEYKGVMCEGKRWGRGVQYDRKGNKVFDGEWVNDEHSSKSVVLSEENRLLHSRIEELIVSNNSCNGEEWKLLDLSFIHKLRLLEIGDDCFENVNEVMLAGLKELERVVIGKKCFTKCKNDPGHDPNRHFYLKNCERVRELKIGRYSFSDYSVCEIENVPSLEVIEMGELNEESSNFNYASLELKSDCERMK